MMTGDEVKASLPILADAILKSAGAEPYSMSGEGSIAGVSGQSFQSALNNPNGVKLDVMVVLVKLSEDHVASLATLKVVGLDTADISAVDDLVSRVQFIGVK